MFASFIFFRVAFTFDAGINSIPEKLADMCPKFELWDSWFGCSQKYAPSSIVQSPRPSDGIDNDEDGGSEGDDDDGVEQDGDVREDGKEERVDDASDGGADGRYDDAVQHDEGVDADNSSLVANVDADDAPSVPPSVASLASEPRSPPVGVGRGRGRGRGVSAAAATANAMIVAQQKGLLVQAVMNRPPIVTSASQSTSGTSGSGKNVFDTVYADAAKNKCAVMKELATQRCEVETQQQQSEHAFKREERCAQQDFQKEMELQKQSTEHRFLREQQAVKLLADRQETKVRKGIEYDKTLASLLVADKSGALADDFEKRRKRERDDDAQDVDPLASFLSSLIPRNG